MALIVRAELRLTSGKAAVQVAHAAVQLAELASRRSRDAFDAWQKGGAKKIALQASTLEAMEELERKARSMGIPAIMVEDAGLTEVAPGTRTVLGLGPARSEELDRITGSLDLL
ncbi:MAG: peptidyl-tRNA hydrolase Pth2 [Thermoplasmata archaeon]|nr:peptidyl-tRNA hydrolase Pth2 [Thermoplasmata archaeon]